MRFKMEDGYGTAVTIKVYLDNMIAQPPGVSTADTGDFHQMASMGLTPQVEEAPHVGRSAANRYFAARALVANAKAEVDIVVASPLSHAVILEDQNRRREAGRLI